MGYKVNQIALWDTQVRPKSWRKVPWEWIATSLDESFLWWSNIMTNFLKWQSQTYSERFYDDWNTIWIWYNWAWLFLKWCAWQTYWSSYDTYRALVVWVWKPYNWEFSNWLSALATWSQRYYSRPSWYTITCDAIYEKTDKTELVMKLTITFNWWTYVRYVVIKSDSYGISENYSVTWYDTLSESPITNIPIWFRDGNVDVQYSPNLLLPQKE